jgi:hypothetical protein
MTEAEMLATLLPCVDGPISNAAIQLIASGEFQHYASTRGVVIRILESHKHKPGPASNVDDQARVLNLIQTLTEHGRTRESAIRQARASSDLDQNAFEAACAPKPSWRIRKRAKEVRGVRVTCTPTRDSQPNEP